MGPVFRHHQVETQRAAAARRVSTRFGTTFSRAYSHYRIQFIGQQGHISKEVPGTDATYTIRGDERYVRAKVIESNGHVAWTQPVMVTAGW